MKRLLSLLFLIPLLAACIGKATPPQQIKMTQAQNEVIGKFAREIGERELNIMLRDPYDATLPGIPVGDLLYILTQVNEDRLIQLVQGVGATTVLELLIAMKRVGCTRANTVPIASGYGFDARSIPSLNNCKWQHLHLPNIMVQLLNGASANGMTTLIDTLKHSYTNLGLAANKPLRVSLPTLVGNATYDATVQHYSYLMKLAYVVVGFDTPTSADPNLASPSLVGPPKLYNLMNLAIDGRDMVFVINMLDLGTCPGIPSATSNCTYVDASNNLTTYDSSGNLWSDIAAGNQMQETQNLLTIMTLVTSTTKMATLINGYRSTRYNLSEDEGQVRYFVDRLKIVLEHQTTCTATSYPVSTAAYLTSIGIVGAGPQAAFQASEQALQDVANPIGGSSAWNNKLATMINLIGNVNRMMDLVYFIDDGFDSNHTSTGVCPARGIDNLMVMVNNINGTDPHLSVSNTTNNEVTTGAYLIDNVALDPTNNIIAKRNKVKYLAENMGTTLDVLQLACNSAVADQADAVWPTDATSEVCDSRGMLNLVASGSKLDDGGATDLTAAGKKMVNLIGQVTDVEDVRFLVRKLKMKQMSDLIAGLLISGTGNVANLINQINGVDCWASGSAGGSSPISATVTAPAAGTYTADVGVRFDDAACLAAGAPYNVAPYYDCPTGKALRNAAGGIGQVIVLNERGASNARYFPVLPTVTFMSGAAAANTTPGMCFYDGVGNWRGFPSATSTGATGLGKMVNVVNHISGSITNLITLINNITDGQKLGILINGIGRSSNLVGVVNATIDTNRSNNATMADMISLLNTISRHDTYKLFHMLENLGNAQEVNATDTIPSGDHDLVAQLIAPYNQANIGTTSGVGATPMANLMSALSMDGGGNYASTDTITLTTGGPCGGVLPAATGLITASATGQISGVTVVSGGAGCTSNPAISLSGGGTGSGAVLVPYVSGGVVQRINVLNSGSGYSGAIGISFSGGCGTLPTATVHLGGAGAATVTNAGSGYTCNPSMTVTTGGGSGAIFTPTISGSLTLTSFSGGIYPGTNYVAGQNCPIVGAGGTGATCNNITLTGTGIASCSTVTGGSGYGVGRIVKIGGNAEIRADVNPATGAITGYTIINSGCGYTGAPVLSLFQNTATCTAPVPTANVVAGRISAIVGGLGGTGCLGVKVGVSYVTHGDGATAIVADVPGSVTGGVLTSISVSEPAVNAAQLVALLDRDGTGQGAAITMNNASPAVGGVSAREAMIRLLHHGVTPSLASSKAWFSSRPWCPAPAVFTFDSSGTTIGTCMNGATPAWTCTGGAADMSDNATADASCDATTGAVLVGAVAGNYTVNWPGVGADYIAGSILNNVSATSTQTLINMVNNDTTDLVDTTILLGCADRSTYVNASVTSFSWQQLCSEVGPGVW